MPYYFDSHYTNMHAHTCTRTHTHTNTQENYARRDPVCVQKVKALYKELDLEQVCIEFAFNTLATYYALIVYWRLWNDEYTVCTYYANGQLFSHIHIAGYSVRLMYVKIIMLHLDRG